MQRAMNGNEWQLRGQSRSSTSQCKGQSSAIKDNELQSMVIEINQGLALSMQRAINCNQFQSIAIKGNPEQ
jgi:hypothetical protein